MLRGTLEIVSVIIIIIIINAFHYGKKCFTSFTENEKNLQQLAIGNFHTAVKF